MGLVAILRWLVLLINTKYFIEGEHNMANDNLNPDKEVSLLQSTKI